MAYHRRVRLLALGVLAVACSACTIEPIDLEGRQCPCATGWVCDESQDVCVRALRDGGGMDARVHDAGAVDAASVDSGPVDAGGTLDGGGTRDAGGMRDAGSEPDAGLDSTSCDDAHAGAIFCDGFESGASMPEWDGVSVSAGTGTWTSSETYRGGGAFHATSSAPNGRAYDEKVVTPARTSGEIHLRAYTLVRSSPAITEGAILFATENANPYDGLSVQITDGMIAAFGWDTDFSSTMTFPTDRWVCVELSITIGASGSFAISVDGHDAITAAGIDTRVGSGYATINVGLDWTGSSNVGGDVLIDEVVLDDAPIGCD